MPHSISCRSRAHPFHSSSGSLHLLLLALPVGGVFGAPVGRPEGVVVGSFVCLAHGSSIARNRSRARRVVSG